MTDSIRQGILGDNENYAAPIWYTPHDRTEGKLEGLPVSITTGAHLMKAHILVVDDDPRITDLLRRIFAYEGYSVAVAASGEEALKRTLERPPDLIVLDLMLPGLDGLEVVQRLRLAEDQVPVLMLTARDAVSDRVKGLDAGADDYLVKPFAPEELVARVKAMLRRNQPDRQEVLRYADLELNTGTRIAQRAGRVRILANRGPVA